MSKEKVKNFFTKLESAPELKKAFTEILEQNQKAPMDTLAEKICGFGKTSGFEFSKADLAAARAELIDKMNSNGELSESDLDKVAGGGARKDATILHSIISGGLSCALASIENENHHGPGGCNLYLSLATRADSPQITC